MALVTPAQARHVSNLASRLQFLIHLGQQSTIPLANMPEDLPQEFEIPNELRAIYVAKYDAILATLKAAVASLPDRA